MCRVLYYDPVLFVAASSRPFLSIYLVPGTFLPRREEVLATFCMLRQQAEKESDDPYLSQADFIAPKVTNFPLILIQTFRRSGRVKPRR